MHCLIVKHANLAAHQSLPMTPTRGRSSSGCALACGKIMSLSTRTLSSALGQYCRAAQAGSGGGLCEAEQRVARVARCMASHNAGSPSTPCRLASKRASSFSPQPHHAVLLDDVQGELLLGDEHLQGECKGFREAVHMQ